MMSNPLYCVLLFASCFIYSQTDSHIFKNITAADGLSQHSVNSIIQDHQGFLWFATNDGLNKYDGYSFKVFRPDPSDTKAISGRIIQDIQVDSHGNLWIASLDGGLIHFDSKIELFTNLNSIIPDFGSYANRVSIGPDGVLWAQFQSKICYAVVRENINDMVFSSFIDKNLFSNSDQLKRLYVENNQVFFETKHTTYTLKYSKTDYTLEGIVLTPEPENNHIAQILGPEEAVWDLNKESETYITHTLNAKISSRVTNESAVVDNEGSLWCVIEDRLSVVSITDGQLQKKVVDFEYLDFLRIKNNRIKSIFFDNTGNLWVGTNGGGIYKKTNSNFKFKHFAKNKTPHSLNGNKIRSLHEDQFGNLWIGTEGGGVSFLDKQNKNYDFFTSFNFSKSSLGISSKNVLSISENILDQNNSIIWFSTEDGGLNKLVLSRDAKPHSFRFQKYNKPTIDGNGIKSRAIHSIFGEGEKRLWIGYYNIGLGLANWEGNSDEMEFVSIDSPNEKSELSGKIIRDIYRDSFGILWLSTNNGLNKLNENSTNISKSTFISYKHDLNDQSSIASNYILQLFESSDNTLWVGTFGGGLNKMLRSADGSVLGFKRFNKQNALFPDDVINSITEDNRGMLWVGTNNGLIEFDPKTEVYKTYDLSDLQNPEMSELSAIKRLNGDLVFGGINGINVFTPPNSDSEDVTPRIVLTDFNVMYEPVQPMEKVNGSVILEKSITHTDQLYLGANLSNFSIGFSSLHFGNPSLNEYKYILEGFDTDWIQTNSDHRIANYTNIPAGDYVFKVFGSNENGTWATNPATLEITIYPPWYLSNMALVFYVIFFTVLLSLYGRYTLIEIRQKRKLEYDRIEKVKEKELNFAKLEFFTNISHELRSPLTLILGPIEKLINKMDSLNNEDRLKSYKTIQRNADYLLKLTKQLLDFRKLEQGKLKLTCSHTNINKLLETIIEQYYPLANKKHILIDYNYPEAKIFAWIDINKFEKIIHNLLSNAIKFTNEKGKIFIDLKIEKSSLEYPDGLLEVIVKDNGRGISSDDLNNIFTRFYQVKNTNKPNDGVGIGLALSQSLANIHGGLIDVKSELNVGSCFILKLPMGASHLTSDQMVEDQNFVLSKMNSIETSNVEAVQEVVTYQNGDKPIILIIEDNYDINHYIASELSDRFNVTSCMSGESGLEIAFKKLPDIIISDVMMNGLNGIEVCEKLKSDIRTNHIPLILLSAKTTNESKVQGLKAGADVYLIKPFNIEVLKMQIDSLIKNRERIHQEFKKSLYNPSSIEITDVNEEFIKNVIKIIENNLDNPSFTTKELADKAGMSRTTFYNKIKSITGLKPTEFVRNYRLNIAAQYLQKGFSVKESMHKTGFNTAGYFTQSFKNLFKLKPSEYTANL